jgi:hypothetical protein
MDLLERSDVPDDVSLIAVTRDRTWTMTILLVVRTFDGKMKPKH